MDIKNYQNLAATTLKTSNEALTGTEIALMANCLGLAGESGELIDYIKKVVWHRHSKIDSQESLKFIKKELGDVLWYIAAICTTANINLEEIAEANIAKLKLRYPEGFTTEASVNRIDTIEDYDDDSWEDFEDSWEEIETWEDLDTQTDLANYNPAYNTIEDGNIFGTGLSTLDDEAGYDNCEPLEDLDYSETELEHAEQEYMRAGLA